MARGLAIRLFPISTLSLMKGHMTSPRSHTLIEQNIFSQVNKKRTPSIGVVAVALALWTSQLALNYFGTDRKQKPYAWACPRRTSEGVREEDSKCWGEGRIEATQG